MRYRILLFEDEDSNRKLLRTYFRVMGYEVFDYRDPYFSKLGEYDKCPCSEDSICAHFLITDVDMPYTAGLEFIARLKQKNCKIANIAIMSGGWSNEDHHKAVDMGCMTFDKPFWLKELKAWLDICAKSIDPSLRLVKF